MVVEDIEIREKFLHTLDWLLAVLARRADSTPQFCLARVSYGSAQQIGAAFGAADAVKRLIDVTVSLRKSMRRTDLIARDGVDLWILTPYTPATEIITRKLKEVVDASAHKGLGVVDRDIEVFFLPQAGITLENDTKATDLLDTLRRNGSSLSMMKIVLPQESQS